MSVPLFISQYSLHGFSPESQSHLLANTGNHKTLVVARRLALDATGQAAAEALLVSTLDVGQFVAVPVVSDNTADEQLVLGTRASHGVLEELGGVHILVDGVSELEEERVLHVSREFL